MAGWSGEKARERAGAASELGEVLCSCLRGPEWRRRQPKVDEGQFGEGRRSDGRAIERNGRPDPGRNTGLCRASIEASESGGRPIVVAIGSKGE